MRCGGRDWRIHTYRILKCSNVFYYYTLHRYSIGIIDQVQVQNTGTLVYQNWTCMDLNRLTFMHVYSVIVTKAFKYNYNITIHLLEHTITLLTSCLQNSNILNKLSTQFHSQSRSEPQHKCPFIEWQYLLLWSLVLVKNYRSHVTGLCLTQLTILFNLFNLLEDRPFFEQVVQYPKPMYLYLFLFHYLKFAMVHSSFWHHLAGIISWYFYIFLMFLFPNYVYSGTPNLNIHLQKSKYENIKIKSARVISYSQSKRLLDFSFVQVPRYLMHSNPN